MKKTDEQVANDVLGVTVGIARMSPERREQHIKELDEFLACLDSLKTETGKKKEEKTFHNKTEVDNLEKQ